MQRWQFKNPTKLFADLDRREEEQETEKLPSVPLSWMADMPTVRLAAVTDEVRRLWREAGAETGL
ncbi:MAG TPA: hypothetical protein VNG90_04945 [Candidatus Acidoferrum sp.]|nr:hypothetical protein [Candidatus Acidoferrum sp.]